MFEVLLLGAALFFGGLYLLKFILFILGVILSGFGFILKLIFSIILAVVFFPLSIAFAGGILSSGIIGFILICAVIGAIVGKREREPVYY